jgi:hypothetical protein
MKWRACGAPSRRLQSGVAIETIVQHSALSAARQALGILYQMAGD